MYYGQTRPMVEYDRQIRYLDFMENGQRTRGAGFVKLERQDNLCSISLQISGLYRKDRLVRPLLLLSESAEAELCKLQLADGGIKLYLDRLDCHNLDGQGMGYESLTGLRIPISENKEICCMWGMRQAARPVVREVAKTVVCETAAAVVSEPMTEPMTESVTEPMKELSWEPALKQEPEFIPLQEMVPRVDISRPDEMVQVEDAPMPMPADENMPALTPETPVIKDDKWEQLWAIYPHTAPFSDGREYLSMGPSDFVILAERHYKLANNSFLLHGYYNYHHLILTRIRERNQMRYYIGVPGVFLEREKRTAIMFGFQSFECAIEPAEEGDFGYYMIPVEL